MIWGTNAVSVPVGSFSYTGTVADAGSGVSITSGTVIYTAADVVFEPRLTPVELFGVGTGLALSLMSVVFLTSIARKVVTNGPSFND